MNYKSVCNKVPESLFLPIIITFIALFIPSLAGAQGGQSQSTEKEQPAFCKIKLNSKEFNLKANKAGFFPQVLGFQPSAVVPITVVYPQGAPGEKVIISAEDGGGFENNKKAIVVSLDAEKKCVFNFRLSLHDGLFEIILRKGEDAKMIQLWVGED